MSQIMTICRVMIVALALSVLIGCGSSKSNDQAAFDSGKLSHSSDWLTVHGSTAQTSTGNCTECHGEDLAGGITEVSCASCHMDGPLHAHPADWTQPKALSHGYDALVTNGKPCANAACHGANLLGGLSGPSCVKCHIGGTMAVHPPNWWHGTYVTTTTDASCKNIYCHGANLQGVTNSGAACNYCHVYP